MHRRYSNFIVHLDNSLKWVWGTAIVVGLVLPFLSTYLQSLFLENQSWALSQPVHDWLPAYGLWFLGALALLAAATIAVHRLADRARAIQNVKCFKPAERLLPEDLDFEELTPEQERSKVEEMLNRDRRPFYKSVYVPRRAVPYDSRAESNPPRQFDEDALAGLLEDGNSLLLIGQPLEGKTRTLYQIVQCMRGWKILIPKEKDSIPSEEHLSLLIKKKRVIMLVNDLTDYANGDVNLTLYRKTLLDVARNSNSRVVVAATCQDNPQLSRVKSKFSGFYDALDRPETKLALLRPTPEEKGRIADLLGEAWTTEKSQHYATLGGITMMNRLQVMTDRFRELLDCDQEAVDVLRGLKLLAEAGLPLSHSRLKMSLRHAFGYSSLNADAELDTLIKHRLNTLARQSFLHSPGDQDPVDAEPAYLRYVVTYSEGKSAEQDSIDHFDERAADLLAAMKEIDDAEGLFIIGNVYSDSNRYLEAINIYDMILDISRQRVDVLSNRGVALAELGRLGEALEDYGKALEIDPGDSKILGNKIVALSDSQREEEASELLCRAWRNRQNLSDGGADLLPVFTYLGKRPGDCE